MLVVRRVVLAVTCFAALPTLAHAQASFRAGVAIENGKWQYTQGFSLEGSYTLRPAERVGVRFDVGVQAFMGETRVRNYIYPCRSPGCTPPLASSGRSLTAVSSTSSLVYTAPLGARNSVYAIAGFGAYVLNDMPSGHYTRAGLNAGGGVRLGHNVVAEFRYHGLIEARGTRGFIPITVGLRF